MIVLLDPKYYLLNWKMTRAQRWLDVLYPPRDGWTDQYASRGVIVRFRLEHV